MIPPHGGLRDLRGWLCDRPDRAAREVIVGNGSRQDVRSCVDSGASDGVALATPSAMPSTIDVVIDEVANPSPAQGDRCGRAITDWHEDLWHLTATGAVVCSRLRCNDATYNVLFPRRAGSTLADNNPTLGAMYEFPYSCHCSDVLGSVAKSEAANFHPMRNGKMEIMARPSHPTATDRICAIGSPWTFFLRTGDGWIFFSVAVFISPQSKGEKDITE
ncbi:Methyl-accepting chemotaxis protein [Anopheles sinensis]|uniref:Methyl-accepting chemotaxis protein n=1 Tax=Anopheles sinensis TaxID=74873 RepID=A0A084VWP8_ANOSI|nr:Methyl-accepting chemotaxis protein [Anopheles sinensis]